jgi:hypothetical protein
MKQALNVLLATAGLALAVVSTQACSTDTDLEFATGGSGGGASSGSLGAGAGTPGGCAVNGQECPVLCDTSLGCVECLDDSDCGAAAPACIYGRCEQCGDKADCPDGQSCYPENHECRPSCTSGQDCTGDAPICDATGACVGCETDMDCPSGEPLCDPLTKQCVECTSSTDCGAASPVCDLPRGDCVLCLVDGDCGDGEVCNDRQCVPTPESCGASEVLCPDGCFDLSSDPAHCGACDTNCGPGTCVSGTCQCGGGSIVCEGACVDPSTDPNHCGGCPGQNCGNGQSCVSGVCQCDNGTQACGQGGCVDTANDPNNCGGCGNQCNQGQYCDGTCKCLPGLTLVNGQCVDTQSNPNACGQGQQQCADVCQNGACVAGCQNPLQECDGACVDLDRNPLHCGDCGNRCDADEVCSNGNCRNWEVGIGCNSCPCSSCGGDFGTCCTFPGDATLVICVDGDCPQ